MVCWELFWAFAKVGVFCVGGGYASMPLIQAAVVADHPWMTLAEFIDIFTISQMTPGPIGVNAATFAGTKVAGLGGSLAATLGFVAPSLCLCLLLSRLVARYGDIGAVRGVLNGVRPAVVALIVVAALQFIFLALWNVEGVPEDWSACSWQGATVLLLALLAVRRKAGVISVLLGSGLLGLLLFSL